LNTERFLNTKSCPLCYGLDICSELTTRQKHHIALDDNFYYTHFLQDVFNIKNVYYAIDNYNSQRLVVKKLAHNSELVQFDKEAPLTRLLEANRTLISQKLGLEQFKQVAEFLEIENLKCASQRLLDMIYKSWPLEFEGDYLSQNLLLFTVLKINFEPIVLKLFRKEENWPFPLYYGSCGRVLIESFEGQTLNAYLPSPFLLRVKIAKALLESLFRLDANELDLAVYMVDLSFENVAFNEKTGRVYFIDTESVVITDKRQIREENPSWNESFYLLEFDQCAGLGECLRYNVNEMCSSYHVDINFYSGNLISQVRTW